MNRRTFIASVGTAATVALAGCLGGENEKITLVEDYFEAVDEGDMTAAAGFIHNQGEGPFDEQEDITVDAVEEWDLEEVADAAGIDQSTLEDEDNNLVEFRGFDGIAYVYGDIETGSEGDIEVYYRLVEDGGLWYIMTEVGAPSDE